MSDKNNIIDYITVKNLLLYSILIYKIDENNEDKNLQNIINQDLFKNEKNIFDNFTDLDKNDYILDYFYCDKTHMYSFIIKNDINKSIKIIFRGSSENLHMMYNLKIKQRKITFLENNNIKIHSGFYQQIFKGKLYHNIKKYLNNIENIDDYLIYCTGHSLGGVMATLFGYFSSYVFKNNKIAIISFGSSKIGNYDFKESFNKKENIICYRFYNNHDFIIQLPPIINYEHVGIPIKLNTINNIYFNILGEHGYNSYLNNLLNDTW